MEFTMSGILRQMSWKNKVISEICIVVHVCVTALSPPCQLQAP